MFDHEKLKVFFRGEIVDFDKATISVANTGLLYGLGVFTGIRAHYNKEADALYVFRLQEHFERLRFSCKICNYETFLTQYDYQRFSQIIKDLFSINKIREDSYIRVTNFSDENRVLPKFVDYKDSLSVFLYPLGDYVPTGGMRCKVSSWTRVNDNAIPARAKFTGAYVNTAFAKTEALKGGYDEAIFLDRNGHVVEGSAENIFIVINGTVITPPPSSDILEGITRRSVLEICKNESIEVVEREIDRSELYKAEEIFLSGTGAKVSPVVEVDDRAVGDGTVGVVAKKIQDLYFKAVRGEDPRYLKWLTKI